MVALYLALGIAMISGISAMMQIGNNINSMMILSTFKRDDYFQTKLPEYDRKILRILANFSDLGTDVCSHVIEKMENDEDVLYRVGEKTPSGKPLFFNSCVITNIDDNHRVLIKKEYPYKMFSCYLKDEDENNSRSEDESEN